MDFERILKKLTSRKFIAMLLGVGLGVAIAFGIKGEEVSTIAGAVTSIVSLVYYMFTEGKIDEAALNCAPGPEQMQGDQTESLLAELYRE
jgi:hypothetical protein